MGNNATSKIAKVAKFVVELPGQKKGREERKKLYSYLVQPWQIVSN